MEDRQSCLSSFRQAAILDGTRAAADGPLPMEAVLRYGAQIAGALHRAHRQGIVRRDLKPGNIMLTKAGAKLLDFALAKSHNSATEQKPLTAEGTILGTFQYITETPLTFVSNWPALVAAK